MKIKHQKLNKEQLEIVSNIFSNRLEDEIEMSVDEKCEFTEYKFNGSNNNLRIYVEGSAFRFNYCTPYGSMQLIYVNSWEFEKILKYVINSEYKRQQQRKHFNELFKGKIPTIDEILSRYIF